MANDLLCFEMWWSLIEGNAINAVQSAYHIACISSNCTVHVTPCKLYRSAGASGIRVHGRLVCDAVLPIGTVERYWRSVVPIGITKNGDLYQVQETFGQLPIHSIVHNGFAIINSLISTEIEMGLQVAEIRPISPDFLLEAPWCRVYDIESMCLHYEEFANWKNAFKRSKKLKKEFFFCAVKQPQNLKFKLDISQCLA